MGISHFPEWSQLCLPASCLDPSVLCLLPQRPATSVDLRKDQSHQSVSMQSMKFHDTKMVSLPSVGQQPISHVHVHVEHETPCTVGLASQHGSNDRLDFI